MMIQRVEMEGKKVVYIEIYLYKTFQRMSNCLLCIELTIPRITWKKASQRFELLQALSLVREPIRGRPKTAKQKLYIIGQNITYLQKV